MPLFFKHIFSTPVLYILLCVFVLYAKNVYSEDHCKFFEVRYKDSLIAKKETSILYNTIKIRNPNFKTERLGVTIKVPKSWRVLSKDAFISGKEFVFTLQPKDEKSISINLLRLPKTSANWDSVEIHIRILDVTHDHPYFYHLRAEADPKFTAQYITEDLELAEKPEAVQLSVRIKNTGNVDDAYTLQWQNQYLGLYEKKIVTLHPGDDTIYNYMLKIPSILWANFHHEYISLCIRGTGYSSYTHIYKLTKPRYIIKESKSPYLLVPIVIEGGLISQNNTYNYYGGIRGDIHFADKNDLHFYYKSKQYGSEVYGIQQNMYLVDYLYHDWKFSAGMIQPIQRFFVSNGHGYSIRRSIDENTEFSIAAVIRDPNFYYTSNNFSALAKYKFRKYAVSQIVSANFDDLNFLNGYAFSNAIQLINNDRYSLSVQAGVGMQEKTKDIPGIKREIWGMTGGYKFSYREADWTINSNIEYYDNNFPGINNGMMTQLHQVTKTFKKKFAGIFYSANYLNSRYFTDTLYNTDILKYNSERYGINTGFKNKKSSLTLSGGIMNESGTIRQTGLDRMTFMDINYSLQCGKSSSLLLNSQNAFKNNVGINNENVLITSSMLSFNVGWPGIMAIYTRRPIMGYEGTSQKIDYYDETICGGPFVKFNFFKNKLNGMVKYQVSKSVYDEVIRTSVVGGLNYVNEKIGTSIQLSGNIPTSTIVTNHQLPISEEQFLTLSVSKLLNIPVITHKLFYNMKLVLFYDANNNGVKDENEETLENVLVKVNNNELLLTNKRGVARYMNIEKGNYSLELNTIPSKGLVPVNGLIQPVYVGKNTTIEIPYKKGRIIKGNIKIVRDSFSRTVFTADEIKVTATDTSGRNYVTVTNKDGNFSFSLPAGIYIVSLNPNAFEGSDFTPEKISFTSDLFKNNEDNVFFIIKQKNRKVRFLEKGK